MTQHSHAACRCWGNGPIEEIFPFRVPQIHNEGLTMVLCVLNGNTARGSKSMPTLESGNAAGSHVESRRRVRYYIWHRVHRAETWRCGGGWGRKLSTQLVVS